MKYVLWLVTAWLLAGSGGGRAQAAELVSMATYGAFETGGVQIEVDGLTSLTQAKLYIRKVGGEWREAHPFIRYDGNHMAGSLFGLELDTEYEVRAELEGRSRTATLRTRPEWSLPAAQRIVEVADDEALQAAIRAARPGDHIVLAPGTYSEPVHIQNRSGEADARIVLRSADPHEKAVLLGGVHGYMSGWWSVCALELNGGWVPGMSAALSFHSCHAIEMVGCVLRESSGDDKGGMAIYVRSDDRWSGPEKGGHLIMNNTLLELDHEPGGTYAAAPRQTSYGIKFNYMPCGFTVIRGNTIIGFSDGISPGGDEGGPPVMKLDDLNVLANWPNQNVDIYDNYISGVTDDCIETDGHLCNARIFRNRMGACVNALTVAPVYPGPVFVVRNRIYGFTEGSVKMNDKVPGETRNVYIYHNTIKARPHEKGGIALYRGLPAETRNIVLRNNIIDAGSREVISTDIASNAPCENYHINHDYDDDLLWSTRTPGRETLFRWGYSGYGDDKGQVRYRTFEAFQRGTAARPPAGFDCPEQRVIPQEPNGIFADPRLELAPVKGFPEESFIVRMTPAADSPAIDAAVRLPGINDRFAGAAPDIGAVEVGLGGQ